MPANLENSEVATGLEKAVFIPIPKKGNAKECSNYCTIALISHAVKVMHSICQQIWKTQQWPQDWKRSVFIPNPKTSKAKECSNYYTVALISHASKVILKILKPGFNRT